MAKEKNTPISLFTRRRVITFFSSLAGLLAIKWKIIELNSYIPLGKTDTFKPGSVTTYSQEHIHLVRLDDGGFLALSPTCPHLRCSIPWEKEKKQFICPCHGSQFDIKGDLLAPPASRGLDSYKLKIKDGQVLVSLTPPERRIKFHHSQLTYAHKRATPRIFARWGES